MTQTDIYFLHNFWIFICGTTFLEKVGGRGGIDQDCVPIKLILLFSKVDFNKVPRKESSIHKFYNRRTKVLGGQGLTPGGFDPRANF